MRIINTNTMNDNQKERFSTAFYKNWPNDNPDTEAQNPWGCPWLTETQITVDGDTPEEWGRSYWKQIKDEVLDLLAQEEAEQAAQE